MDHPVRLIFAVHNHQPVGNFDGVFEDAYNDSYTAFLDVLEKFPSLAITLHNSGSLLEWLEVAHPEYLERLRHLVSRGQLEILGGPFYEPILACIPRRDRVGQVRRYLDHLQELFGEPVRGAWIPERVWEPGFASDLVEAGIEYTLLDDSHFRGAGLNPQDLSGYYLTEDEGKLLKVFPISEPLRYAIPFADVEEPINVLRQIGERHPGAVVTFGDDGEKFGTWPESKKHCYEDGWLHRFFEQLAANQDWLKVVTMAEAVQTTPPAGKCYLPDASYREMTEWVLPTSRQQELMALHRDHREDHRWEEVKTWMRGGYWKNFLAKYSEANEMYCRMMEVSERFDHADQISTAPDQRAMLSAAQTDLFRGQCNCPYWHGAFGGLYLPHLRNAIYKNLIAADNRLQQLRHESSRWVEAYHGDLNLDARQEICLNGDRLAAYIAPARGGHLYELDLRSICHNVLATLNRRPEPYHQKIWEFAQGGEYAGVNETASVSSEVKFKQPDLHLKLNYDHWPRKAFVDHLLPAEMTVEQFRTAGPELTPFATAVYQAKLITDSDVVCAELTRPATYEHGTFSLKKSYTLDRSRPSELSVTYELSDLPEGTSFVFASELNFAGMASQAEDRYYYNADGQRQGMLNSELDLQQIERIGLVDEWLGLDIAVDLSVAGNLWTFPIETVSQSEGGFELVHQSSCVVLRWPVTIGADGKWSVTIKVSCDTSAAQARMLNEKAVTVS